MQLRHSKLRKMKKTKHTLLVVDAQNTGSRISQRVIGNTETSQMHLNFGQ